MGSAAEGKGRGWVTWRVSGLRQELEEPDGEVLVRAARSIGVDPAAVRGQRFARRSVDARGRGRDLHFVCQVDVVAPDGPRSPRLRRLLRSGRVAEAPPPEPLEVPGPGGRVVVVGAGPGGLFAALAAALSGAEVTLVERGEPIERRGRKVVAFHRGGAPDADNNLLFGDGGAGTYSDGKLYTRVSDPLEASVIEELVRAGAPADIAFDARAHIGTDVLHRMLPRLRARLQDLGVRFLYGVRATGLTRASDPVGQRVLALRTEQGELELDALVLCVGHSARDTWEWLARDGVAMEAKPFQVGVRIEHPQELITRGRYGPDPRAQVLGPASYNLQSRGDVPAHSFCMCPGGRIVASVSEPGGLCTNGMSNSRHSSRWANAALVTTLDPEAVRALGHEGPLAGVHLQRELERRFFEAGGGTYAAPAQRASDFREGRRSSGELRTSYGFGAVGARVDELLPGRVRDAIAGALGRFERTIPGFAGDEGLLVGIETRSSGPIRLPRDRGTFLARGFANLYPAGEGAGYAGGIMSAAIDGARAARAAVGGAR
ncbi:MAG: NAD(P)/FAD-dependent oxidoreductase [Planctomycetota bacterium]|jgi:hypothetical protein